MKTLIVSQYFWLENFRINDLAQELMQREHSVKVLTGIPNYPTETVFKEYQETLKAFEYYFETWVFRVPILALDNVAMPCCASQDLI